MTTTFGALLRQLRRRAQMTQADLAAAVGYSVSFISSLEQNTRRPDVHSILQHFVPALALQEEPHLATHLLELAAATQGDLPPTTALTVTREQRIVITATNPEALTTLPTPPTPLIGRDQTVKMLCDRLLGHQGRLLTLVGPPGVGKTRLALAVAATLQPLHPDGVYFVPLAPVSDPDFVASALTSALGLTENNPKPPLSRLLAFLRHKELLLLLDNFEQVIATAPLVAELLAGCPRLRVLVTSRERLHLRAEQRFLVPPLDLPVARALFVQRVQAVDPDFTLTAQDKATVGAICLALDCLPLALELSAAHLAIFTPATLLERLQGTRLDLLSAGPADLPVYQRSLRAAFDHSWRLLSVAEQTLLAQLSVFRGSFDFHALQGVTGAAPQFLLTLVDKSLVRRQRQGRSGVERCDLHELIRQAAAERLAQVPTLESTTRDQHSAFYCHLLRDQETRLHGPSQHSALTQLALELDNIRTAWQWAVDQQQIARLDSAIHSLGLFYEWRNHYQEGETVYRNTVYKLQRLAQPSPPAQWVLAAALAWQSVFTRIAGRLTEASQLLQQSLVVLVNLACGFVNSQDQSTSACFQLTHPCDAPATVIVDTKRYQQVVALYEMIKAQWGKSALWKMDDIVYCHSYYTQDRQLYDASRCLFQIVGDVVHMLTLYECFADRAKIARGQIVLGGLVIYAEHLCMAFPMIPKSTNLFEELVLPLSIISLGLIHLELGEYDTARTKLEVYIAQSRSTGNQSGLAFILGVLACISNVEGNYGEAEQLATESAAICQQTQQVERWIVATGHLGYAARGLGKPAIAQQRFITVLEWAVANQGAVPLFFGLAGIALLMADQGEVEQAVELYAHLADLPMVATSQLRWDLVGKQIATCAATLPPAVADAARARGKAGDLWTTAAALLREFNRQK